MTTAQTHQPVAYQIEDANGEFMCLSRTKSTIRGVTSVPLYTSPQRREPQCKFPTCHSQEYQRKLADDVASDFIGPQRSELLTDGMLKITMRIGDLEASRMVSLDVIKTSNAPEIERHSKQAWLDLQNGIGANP